MENQEFTFAGKTLNGIAMLIFNLLVYVVGIALIVLACTSFSGGAAVAAGVGGGLLVFANLFVSGGFVLVEPGEAGERQDGQPRDDWHGARVEAERHVQGDVRD